MALHWRMHILHLSLVMVVVVTILLATPTPTTAQSLLPPQARPGCHDHCGNLTIPYPFGIGSDCYLDDRFEITCNISAQQPTTLWMTSDIKITDISLYDGELQILQFAASDCYDAQGNSTGSNSPELSVPPPYTISKTKNMFVAVGCDTYAFFIGYRGEEEYRTGCMSECDNLGNAIDQRDTCSGVGCCQTKIPGGLQNRTVTLGSFNNYMDVQDSHRCSYAFLVQEGKFNFNSTSFRELNETTKLPAIIDWVIGNESCDIAAKNESTFACKANSYCHNPSSGGYICRCLPGYEGNPYLLFMDLIHSFSVQILMSARLQTPAVWEPGFLAKSYLYRPRLKFPCSCLDSISPGNTNCSNLGGLNLKNPDGIYTQSFRIFSVLF